MSGICSSKFTREEMKATLVNNLRYASDRLLKVGGQIFNEVQTFEC